MSIVFLVWKKNDTFGEEKLVKAFGTEPKAKEYKKKMDLKNKKKDNTFGDNEIFIYRISKIKVE